MRVKFLRFVYVVILLIITIRLFYWQIIRSDDLSVRAEQQRLVSRQIDAPRGLILSSDDAILATNKPTFLLFGQPKNISDKESVAEKLSKILVLNSGQSQDDKTAEKKEILRVKNELLDKLSQELYWVILSKEIDFPAKKEIESLNLEGIGFESQRSRVYPEASSSAHVLGFVGSDSLGKEMGYFGVEGFYNGELKGFSGKVTEEKDARGLPILMGKFYQKEPKNGHDLILNIDRTVQYLVEKKLKEGMQKYGAKAGSVLVMEPKTGAVVAMASFPNYDPNSFAQFPKEYFRNPLVGEAYEPGSTFKVLVMAAAMNENAVDPETLCDICSKPISIAGYTIRTWNNKYYPETSMRDVIIHSDNTGMVFVGQKLGVDKLYKYIQEFGFGELTQIDLQDESTPQIRSKGRWGEIDLATASFGQGIAVTAIQVTRAVAAIANGGKLMEPHVVHTVRDGDKITKIAPKVVGQPISAKTAQVMTEMMVAAVEKGEAKSFVPKGYKIAGKTGTAQIPVSGYYDPNKTIASFIGFAPADDPKFIMLVKYSEPSSSIFGSETAAPTFFAIAKELFTYYRIPPSEQF